MIQTRFVVSGSKAFYSIFVVVFKSVLQKQCRFTKMQFLVDLFVDIKILCSIRSICAFKLSEQVLSF